MASFYADSIRNLHRVGNRGGGIREVVTMDYFAGVCCCACVMQVSVIRHRIDDASDYEFPVEDLVDTIQRRLISAPELSRSALLKPASERIRAGLRWSRPWARSPAVRRNGDC